VVERGKVFGVIWAGVHQKGFPCLLFSTEKSAPTNGFIILDFCKGLPIGTKWVGAKNDWTLRIL